MNIFLNNRTFAKNWSAEFISHIYWHLGTLRNKFRTPKSLFAKALHTTSFCALWIWCFLQTALFAQTSSIPCETSIKQVLLVVDVSGSMETNDRLGEVKQFALSSVKERAKENLLYKLISYGGTCNDILTDVEWTRDVAVISAGIKGLYLRGGTPLGSALEFSIDAIKKSAYPDQTQVLLLNDGANACGEVREILGRRIKEIPCVKISVIGIELEDDENNLADRAKSDAEVISAQTGGTYMPLKDVRELRGVGVSDTGISVRSVALEPRKKNHKAALAQATTATASTISPTTSSKTSSSVAAVTPNEQAASSPSPSSQQAEPQSQSQSQSQSNNSETPSQQNSTAGPSSAEEKKVSSEPTAAKPSEQKPRENKANEQQNAQVQSQEVKSQETKPQETKNQETKNQETQPQETKPAERSLSEQSSAQSPQNKPTQETAVEKKTSQEQPSQEKSSQENTSPPRTEEPQKQTQSSQDTSANAPPPPAAAAQKDSTKDNTPRVKEEPSQEALTPITPFPTTFTTASNEKVAVQTEQIQQEGIVLFFMPNSAALLPAMRKGLERLVEQLRRFPARKIIIDGHSSLEGTSAANLRLSVQRASSVAAYLRTQLAMQTQNVIWNAFGELRPIAENSNAAGQQENRRVEVRVVR